MVGKKVDVGFSTDTKTIKILKSDKACLNITILKICPIGVLLNPVLFRTLSEFIKSNNIVSTIDITVDNTNSFYSDKNSLQKFNDVLNIFNNVFINKLIIHCTGPISINDPVVDILKNYFTGFATFKKICLHFSSDTVFHLLKCLDLNNNVKKISICKTIFPYDFVKKELSIITKLHNFSIKNNSPTNEICYYINSMMKQPFLSKILLEKFIMTREVMVLLVAIMNKNSLQKLQICNYESNIAYEEMNDFSKMILRSNIVSVIDDGRLSKYILINLNSETALKKLQAVGTIYFENFDDINNLIKRLSETNISNFYCKTICPIVSLTNLYNFDIEKHWSNLLENNYTIISFYFLIEPLKIEIKLIELTNRNRDIQEKKRFAKIKPIDQPN